MLRTAGPEYRARLMSGEGSYQDAEVTSVLEMWKGLVDAGYFVDDANAYTWTTPPIRWRGGGGDDVDGDVDHRLLGRERPGSGR